MCVISQFVSALQPVAIPRSRNADVNRHLCYEGSVVTQSPIRCESFIISALPCHVKVCSSVFQSAELTHLQIERTWVTWMVYHSLIWAIWAYDEAWDPKTI